jgi:hypothetical protein
LHKDPKQVDNGNLNPDAQLFKPGQEGATGMEKSNQVGAISAGNAGTANVPTQKVKVHSANGNSIEGLAMVDCGSHSERVFGQARFGRRNKKDEDVCCRRWN